MAITITSTQTAPPVGLPGRMPAVQSAPKVDSRVVDEASGIPAGVAVVPSSSDPAGSVSLPAPAAADPDALVLQDAALGSASEESYSGAALTGSYAAGELLNPPRQVTITQDADGNWDATTATVKGSYRGVYVEDTITITNGGDAVGSTDAWFDRVDSVVIPAQTGAAPGTIGFAAGVENTPLEVAGFAVRSERNTMPFVSGVADTQDEFADGDALAVCRDGRIFVASEDAASAGDLVYVRVVAGGSEQLGAVRSTPDSTDCHLVEGWRFRTDASGDDNLAELERV